MVVTLLKLSLCRTQIEQLLDTINGLFSTSNSSDREMATNIEDVSNDTEKFDLPINVLFELLELSI